MSVDNETKGMLRVSENETRGNIMECLDNHDGACSGEVAYRMPLSGTGRSFPRCEAHWAVRLDRQAEINRRYPVHAPADFDPGYAGERWDEDY